MNGLCYDRNLEQAIVDENNHHIWRNIGLAMMRDPSNLVDVRITTPDQTLTLLILRVSIQGILGLRHPRPAAICGYVAISHKFSKKVLLHHFDIRG